MARSVMLARIASICSRDSKASNRAVHEFRIAEKIVAIDKRVPHRLGHQVNGPGGMKPERVHIVWFQHTEYLAQGRSSG